MLHFYNVKSLMRYRTFGRTGIELSTVSLGCNRLGDPGVDPATRPPIVERGPAVGVSVLESTDWRSAMRHNVGIMVRTPLARDLLTAAPRAHRTTQVPAAHCVVPGARTIEQLESNVPTAEADLSHDDMERVRQLHCEWPAEGRW